MSFCNRDDLSWCYSPRVDDLPARPEHDVDVVLLRPVDAEVLLARLAVARAL
jgi:hypothetical protein